MSDDDKWVIVKPKCFNHKLFFEDQYGYRYAVDKLKIVTHIINIPTRILNEKNKFGNGYLCAIIINNE